MANSADTLLYTYPHIPLHYTISEGYLTSEHAVLQAHPIVELMVPLQLKSQPIVSIRIVDGQLNDDRFYNSMLVPAPGSMSLYQPPQTPQCPASLVRLVWGYLEMGEP